MSETFQIILILDHYFHSYFFNIDILLSIHPPVIKLTMCVHIACEESVSHIFNLGVSFYFILKNWKPFVNF